MVEMPDTTPTPESEDLQGSLEAADPADAPAIAEALAEALQEDLDSVAGTETGD